MDAKIHAVSKFRVCIPRRPHLKANYVTIPCKGCPKSEGSYKCSPQMGPSFPCLWRMYGYYLSWPHISQDSLCAWKREDGDIAWRRSSLFAGLGGRNCDVRVKHLVMQPGPKARLSHLTTVDSEDSPSKTSKAGSFKGCWLWIKTQQQSSFCTLFISSMFVHAFSKLTDVDEGCSKPQGWCRQQFK